MDDGNLPLSEEFVLATYSNLADAEDARSQLVLEGIPNADISIEEQADPIVEGEPVTGISLGAGVGVEATEALLDEHDNAAVDVSFVSLYVVRVQVGDDLERLEICRQVLGYLA